MPDQIETLKQLQAIDGEIFRLRKQLEDKPRELEQVTAQAAAAAARAKEAEARVKTLQLAQKEKEVDLQTREGNVRKLQGQLFQVKTNREYTAMQHEIDTLKADNSLLEEAILKLFDELDQATKLRQQETQRLASEEERQRNERARIEQELAEVREKLVHMERSRQLLVPDVPPQTLATYERVLALREGLALVPLMDNSCGGCYRRMPPQVINEVYLKAKLVSCESCNRILYFDEAHSKL